MDKFKKILSVATLALVVFIAYSAFSSEIELNGETTTMIAVTINSLSDINIWILLLLIPEQILMYYAAGQIYFAFLRQHKHFKISQPRLAAISLEINFVNHAIPSGGMSGLAYLVWRLKEMKVTAGQVSFIHVLRYAICALANTMQTWISIIVVLLLGTVVDGGGWALWVAGLAALGIETVVFIAWLIVRKQKIVDWLSTNAAKIVNRIVRKLTRGKHRKFLNEETVSNFFSDLRLYYLRIMRNKRILWKPVGWGMFYSFLEIATYWIVSCALGHPEYLPQIAIGEGVASVVGSFMVTPGGVGGYEGAMIAILVATGVQLDVATIIVVITRVFVLVGTIATGYPLYQLSLMSRKDKFKGDEMEKLEQAEKEKAERAKQKRQK